MTATSVVTTVEDFFGAALTDLKTWAGDVETVVVDDAKIAWLALWTVLSAASPAQWKILQDLLATADKDLAADDYAGIVADVVKQAVTEESAWINTTDTAVLTAMVTALKL